MLAMLRRLLLWAVLVLQLAFPPAAFAADNYHVEVSREALTQPAPTDRGYDAWRLRPGQVAHADGSFQLANLTTTGAGNTAPVGPASFSGFVGMNAAFPHSANGNTAINMRSVHQNVVAVSHLKIVPTANFNTTGVESTHGNGASATVKVCVEYPAGTFTRMTFAAPVQSGGDPNTGLIPAADLIETDDVTLAVPIPAFTNYWVRQFWQNANGLWFREPQTGSTGLANSSGAGGDLSCGGTITDNMFANGLSMPPTAIISTTTVASIGVLGDSIAWGFGTGASFASDGREGIILRNFPANTYAFLNFARPGLQSDTQLAGNSASSKLYKYVSNWIIQDGVNNLFVASQSAATTSSNLTALISALPAGKKYTIVTITPEATGGTPGNWSDGTQVPDSRNAARVTYNGLVRAGSVSGVNNGFLEVSDGIEDVRDNGKFKFDGTPFKFTHDGTHTTDAANDNVATTGGITSAILAVKMVP